MSKHAAADDLARANSVIKRVRENLRLITVYYEPALTGHASDDENDRRSPHGAGDPAPLDAITARDAAFHDLHFWCRFILDEINNGSITTIVRAEIPDMAAFIERWSTAIIDQFPDDAANLDKETRTHARKLEELAQAWSTRRIEIGRCPEQQVTQVDGREEFTQCTGTLWALMQSADKLLPKRIVCDQDGTHQWSPSSWRDLGRRLDALSARILQRSLLGDQSPPSSAGSQAAS